MQKKSRADVLGEAMIGHDAGKETNLSRTCRIEIPNHRMWHLKTMAPVSFLSKLKYIKQSNAVIDTL